MGSGHKSIKQTERDDGYGEELFNEAIKEHSCPPQTALTCGKTEGSTVESYALSCSKTLGLYYDGETRVNETCCKVVTSIEPVVAKQNAERERIDYNIKVTYLDGHTRIMAPSSTDYDSTKDYNGEDVILYYTGEVNKAGEEGTLSTTINLTTK